jgi:serine/threonine protein kinase
MGVVHRDIKPENILLDRQGRVKVADFGLAKLVGQTQPAARLTASRQAMGTPHYMAPEQWEKPLQVDHRADIYSLGVVFYELLTGELPLGKFPPPSQKTGVDARVDGVVLRAIEKQPEQRYQQMSEMKTAVEAAGKPAESIRLEEPARPAPLNAWLEVPITAAMIALVSAIWVGAWFLPPHPMIYNVYIVLLVGIVLLFFFEPTGNRYVRRLHGFAFIAMALSLFAIGQQWWLILTLLWGLPWAVGRIMGSFTPSGLDDDEEEASDESNDPVPGLTPQEERLRRLLADSALADYLAVIPDIDNSLLAVARKQCQAAPDDRILAVLDFSGGEGEAALLFGCAALYFCNGDDTPHPDSAWLRYTDLAGRPLVNHGDAVYLGNNLFLCPNPDETGIDCEELANLLGKVRDLMAPPASAAVEKEDESAWEETLRKILVRCQDDLDSLSVVPDIDKDLLLAVREKCHVAADDRIVGVVDFSGGEGESALVVGGTALYGCNGDDTPHPGWWWIDYGQLAGERIVNHGDVVLVGKDQFLCPNPDESGIDCEALAGLLLRVRDARARKAG